MTREPFAVRADRRAQRLYIADDLLTGARPQCTPGQANYLGNVLRLRAGDAILLFNGRDGEWRAELVAENRRTLSLLVREQVRPQAGGQDIDYLFAPLKRGRLDYMVQKATEMGVARLRPVLTRRTVQEKVNLARMRANAIEAAEQCGILRLPDVAPPEPLASVLARWDATRTLIFCDEGSPARDPLAILAGLSPTALGVLVGPEGGFDEQERALMLSRPFVVRIPLGPRVLRADTAAVAALALVNAALGDWR
jgi:16S rRNA (uracil1498-N3)-methyltransferase